MKFRVDPKKPVDLTQWHLWFAWYPVRVGPYLVWLQRIQRRGRLCEGKSADFWIFEYEEPVWYP